MPLLPACWQHYLRRHLKEVEEAEKREQEEEERQERLKKIREDIVRAGPVRDNVVTHPTTLMLVPKFARDQYPELLAKWQGWISKREQEQEAELGTQSQPSKRSRK